MVCSFGRWFPKKVTVTFDGTEQGMLDKLQRISGFSQEELVRKAVRQYYFGFSGGFYGRVNIDDIKTTAEVKGDEHLD